jgi:hypothetical protein
MSETVTSTDRSAEEAPLLAVSAAAGRRRAERVPIVLMEGGMQGATVVRSVGVLTGVSLECPATMVVGF